MNYQCSQTHSSTRRIDETFTSSAEEAKRTWIRITQNCRARGIKFVDDVFPPNDRSIFIDIRRKPNNFVRMYDTIEWLCVSTSKYIWYVYRNPTFSDIKQGSLADCWLLGCLAVILEQPALLEKIFFTTEFSINGEQGVYLVRLCHNGEWKTVVLDDYFPCYASDGQFVCAQSSRYQLWVPLIEKAMAKLNGSYEALAGGNTCESLKTLTGYPCESIYFVRGPKGAASIDSDKIWMQMLSMKENGFIMTATCNRSDVSKETYRMVGLESWHVYSVLSVCEVGNNRLVRLRNPSGKSEWRGDWSKRSSLWTPFMRQVLDEPVFNHYNPSQTDTGVFWMSFDDLAYYFTCVDVCKTRPDWFESRLSGYFSHESDQSMTVFNMIVCETCEINLSFFHKTTDKNRTEKADNDICFAIFEASTHHQKLVGKLVLSVGAGKRLIRESANCEHLFDPGQYLIVPFSFNHWYTNRGLGVVRFPFNLVIHSSKGVIVDQQMFDRPLIAEAMIELCKSKGEILTLSQTNCLVYTLYDDYNGGIIMVENNEIDKYLHIQFDWQKSKNVASTRRAFVTKDSVPPKSRQVLNVLTHNDLNLDWSVNFNFTYKLSNKECLNTRPGIPFIKVVSWPPLCNETIGLHSPKRIQSS